MIDLTPIPNDVPDKDQVFRHYKGGIYVVLCAGSHSETHEFMVVYRLREDDGTGKIWIRPFAMWFDVVKGGKQRFTRVPSLEKKP